jgi:hypothetical protein
MLEEFLPWRLWFRLPLLSVWKCDPPRDDHIVFFCAVVHERRLYIQPSDQLDTGGKVDKGEYAPMFHA